MKTSLLSFFAVLALPLTIFAAPVNVESVEKIMDDPTKFNGKQVRVSGEVEEEVDGRSFVLESGGLLNDKILVVTNKNFDANKFKAVQDDEEVTVTGTVLVGTLADVERDYEWDLSANYQAEFDGNRTYLIADDIVKKQ